MLKIDGRNIIITRGDVLPITITAQNEIDETNYEFQIDDVIRFKILQKDKMENVLLQKDFVITEPGEEQEIVIPAGDMKIGELKSKPEDFWYEIEINPAQKCMTLSNYSAFIEAGWTTGYEE